MFYNPAGPAFLKSAEAGVEVNSIPWAVPTTYWSASGIVPLYPRLNVGLFTSGVHWTLEDQSRECEWQAGVTASAMVSDWLGFGLDLEYDGSRSVDKEWDFEAETTYMFVMTSSAIAADAGVLARPHTCCGSPSIGVTVRNAGTRLKYSNQAGTEALPALVDAGVGWTVTARELGFKSLPFSVPERYFPHDWLMDNWGASVFYDLRKIFLDTYPTHSVGVELRPLPFLAVRGGWFYSNSVDTSDKREGLTWGLGLDLRYFRADFCQDNVLFYLGMQKHYRFSFALNLNELLLREGGLLGH